MTDVLARVETIGPGDRVYTPQGRPGGYEVERVTVYDDGTRVVTYRTDTSSSMRFGSTVLRTRNVLGSLRPLKAGERIRCRRGALERPAGPPQPSS